MIQELVGALASAGLVLGAAPGERFPALDAFEWVAGTPRLVIEDVETLLRSKEPPVGAGYGILPLRVTRANPAEHPAFLSFGRPDPSTGLDALSLIVDGALFREDEARALDLAFDWFVLLCDQLPVLYGWADWETATFLEAAPSRRDVRSGSMPRLMRFNAFAPSLLHHAPSTATANVTRIRRVASGTLVCERARAPA